MSELKPCPFCGSSRVESSYKTDDELFCNDCSSFSAIWNTRPIEDALNVRIAELEAMVDRLIEAGNALSKVIKRAHWLAGDEAVGRWHNLTGKYKEDER